MLGVTGRERRKERKSLDSTQARRGRAAVAIEGRGWRRGRGKTHPNMHTYIRTDRQETVNKDRRK